MVRPLDERPGALQLHGHNPWLHCSRLKPSYEFYFESKTSIQEYRNEIQNSYWTRAWITWYMFPVQCDEWRINHLSPLLVMTMPYIRWFLWQANYLRTSSDVFILNLGLRFEGLFWERYIWKGQIVFEGHWRLQSWTLLGSCVIWPQDMRCTLHMHFVYTSTCIALSRTNLSVENASEKKLEQWLANRPLLASMPLDMLTKARTGPFIWAPN